ncbi:MAG: methyltransferase domain-containing protein [Bacteroidetes bacterium]|nr:methyltransferase domain-containing protein [Bacteroidota bacterium]
MNDFIVAGTGLRVAATRLDAILYNNRKNRSMLDWNPHQYLKFTNERTQPSIDLAARIKLENPRSIIDIGCGPGNSTHVLRERWPNAKLVGLDSSANMIRKAKEDYPDMEWIIGDASNFTSDRTFDVVFSNAALQWMQNHDSLIPQLFSIAAPGGTLAVQVPANNESSLHKAVLSVSSKEKWSKFTSGCESLMNYQTAEYYYNLLAPISTKLDLWETIYYHVLASHTGLIEWYRETGMRIFLERLPDDASRKEFENEVLAECRRSYKIQKDGKVLYPFKRIFFVAYK